MGKNYDTDISLKYSQNWCICCRAYEEDDFDQDEHLVGNPIYSDSLPTASEARTSARESYDVLCLTTGVNPTKQEHTK